MPSGRLIDQERAKRAHEFICQVKGEGEAYETGYKSLTRRLPAMIMVNGLGQALAFLCSKEGGPEGALYEHLSQWLRSKEAPVAWESDKGDLLERIIDARTTSLTYRQATREALAFTGWLKRFAEARLGG